MEYFVTLKVDNLFYKEEDNFVTYNVMSSNKEAAINHAFSLCHEQFGRDNDIILEYVKN